MANIHPDIRPNGLNQKDEVDLLYQIVSSIKGICAKLDDDGGVPLETYEANVFTAIFNGSITDTKGNLVQNFVREKGFYIINPTGMSDAARLECLYQIYDMFETLTEQLDTDVLTDSTYEALCYTALLLHMVTNQNGDTLGNGNAYWFRPGGVTPQDALVDTYYNIVDAIETLTEQLDADGTVTDTDYEALWFTANVLKRVENSQGSVVGN